MAAVFPTGKPKPPPKPVIQDCNTFKTDTSEETKRCITDLNYSERTVKSATLGSLRSNKSDNSSYHSVLRNRTMRNETSFIMLKDMQVNSSIPFYKKMDKPPLLPKPQMVTPSVKLSSHSLSLSRLEKSQSTSLYKEGSRSIERLSTTVKSSKIKNNNSVFNVHVTSNIDAEYLSVDQGKDLIADTSNSSLSSSDISHLSVLINAGEIDKRYSFITSTDAESDCDDIKINSNKTNSTPVELELNDTENCFSSDKSFDDSADNSDNNCCVRDIIKNINKKCFDCNLDGSTLDSFIDDKLENTDGSAMNCDRVILEIKEDTFDNAGCNKRNSVQSDTSNLVNLSRSSSISGSDCSSLLKPSPRNSNYGYPIVKNDNSKTLSNSDLNASYRIDEQSFDDNDSIDENSENSHNVSRRIKSWFSSFGKGGSSIRRRKRDSTFYLDPEEDIEVININTWDSGSLSSVEDRKIGEGTTYLQGDDKPEDKSIFSDDESENKLQEVGIDDEIFIEHKKKRKAYLVVRELISSEKVFIDVLKLLCCDFKHYIMSSDEENPVIPESELMKIINCLPQLLSFNEDLLKDLETRINDWTTLPKISDIIIKKGPFLKLYSTYIQNFEKQCKFLDECCQKYPRFLKVLKDFEASNRCKKLTIKHYMLKPIQRIPQYRLLLQDYLNQQDDVDDSIDYTDTEQALRIVCDVADHANKSVELDAHMSKLLQIQSQLGNYEIIKPGREFVKAGELYKLSRKGLQLRYFILLNDCLLYTSYYGSLISLKVNYELPLAGMKICVPQVEDYHNEFSIISITRSFSLRARSENEREKWVMVLHDTIKEHNRRQLSFVSPKLLTQGLLPQPLNLGKEAPIWVPDHRVTMCQSCTAEFKVTFRRHHCRSCGKVVCGTCSDNKAPLQYMNFQAARVCDACYQYLLKDFEESNRIDVLKNQLRINNEDDLITAFKNIRTLFKKHDADTSKKFRKHIPLRLKEVSANDTGSKMSGWLYRRSRRAWKRYWFVLKEQVLYVYKASEDVKALESIPVLGYTVETFKLSSNTYEDINSKCVFQLAHINQQPMVFYAENEFTADKWISALEEATNLK